MPAPTREGENAMLDTVPEWDPYNYELALSPYATFKRLRDEAPLYYNAKHDFFAMSRFADCEAGLADNETFISGKGVIMEMIRAGYPTPPGFFISNDPPVHTAYRALLARSFTAPRMALLEQQIRDFCTHTLDALGDVRRFDLIRDFASVIPMRVISMLLGIPEEHQEEIRAQAEARLRTEVGKPMTATPYVIEPLFEEFIEIRTKDPSEDMMSELIHREFDDSEGVRRRLTRQEVGNIIQMLSAAGNETTNKLIGWTARLLAQHPDQRAAIREDRSLLVPAIEEVLRCEPPADHVARYVARDFEAYGETVPAGGIMIFLTGAANRDERQFADPEAFNIHRDRKLHLSFGYGPHLCIGAALARIEGRIALDELLNRFPEWDVDETGAKLIPTSSVRGWESLPLVVG